MARTTVAETSIELEISGMTCAACANRIEKRLNRLDGVSATVNYATNRATISGATSSAEAIAAVEKAGYGAHLRSGDGDLWSQRATEERIISLRRRLIVAATLAIPIMDITIVLALAPQWRFPGWEWLCLLLALPVVTWPAWPFHKATLRNLRQGAGSMDTLVSLGIVASFGWALVTLVFGLSASPTDSGFWLGFGATPEGTNSLYLDVAVGMTTFQLAGRYFETRSRRRAGDVLGALQGLAATEVRVTTNGGENTIPIGQLQVGDSFIVLPGETIATDGTVLAGVAAVDTSMLTGEPMPVPIQAGSTVTGGTISTDGRLVVRADVVGSHTQLAHMAALTEDAQARKSQAQRLVDRITTWFVPTIITLAMITAAAWALAGTPISQAYGIGISVLIIACPCALGLATPTALMVGIGRGASLGILIRGHDALEASGKITTIVLDKTGTLTTGTMRVATVSPYSISRDTLTSLAAAVEHGSEHAIARAINDEARRCGLTAPQATHFVALPGLGAAAHVDSVEVVVGKPQLLTDRGIDLTKADVALERAAADGNSVACVARAGQFIGTITLADTLKPDVREAIGALKAQGLRTILLTGDSRHAGERIAAEAGITDVIAEVLPHEKAQVIRDLQGSGERVAMVGDGINDAIALATADLGLGIVTGTDVALKAADIILIRDDLTVIADAVGLSRRTLGTIRLNLVWAFGYNLAAIPLAAAGVLSPLIAAAAMTLSSILVVQNSLRLQNYQARRRPSHASA